MSGLISRKEAIDSIESHLRFGDELYPLTRTDEILNYAFEVAASCVYNLPTAEPERKVGKWILSDLQDENEVAYGNFYYACSCCGASDLHEKTMKVPFCWKCGARMEGGEDDPD